MKPGCRAVTTDTCVPISMLAQQVSLALAEAEDAGIAHFIVGHVGDGNFHVAYLIDPNLPSDRATAERLNAQLVQRAIDAGGTCTGEHGIGLHKQGFLLDEAGPGAVAMMRQIKRALDPDNILNPGKIFAW
jgi:D-lactate dehydrogenase (cytochrome)